MDWTATPVGVVVPTGGARRTLGLPDAQDRVQGARVLPVRVRVLAGGLQPRLDQLQRVGHDRGPQLRSCADGKHVDRAGGHRRPAACRRTG